FVESSLTNKTFNPPPRESAMGSLLDAITNPERAEHFQPTNINFGLFPSIAGRFRDKQSKKKAQLERARLAFQSWLAESTDKSRLPKMTERPLDL
ncbi:MAG TPA: hypothetical protein PLU50_07175, partial [Pseudobdellovibrionaceae bacterium]|nr:hypothetical protein [Pseudobdellovibrionaceae bacterium]